MKKYRILAILATLSIILPSVAACNQSGQPPITEPSEASGTPGVPSGTSSGTVTLPVKPKTPTPQAEFDPGKYPDKPSNPGVTPGIPDSDAPRYPVDVIDDPTLDGYTDLSPMFGALHSANKGVMPAEDSINLFDGYESSKYCVLLDGTVEVIWSMESELPVSAYALATGNDTAEYPDRNPPSWELYGSADGSEESWELIDAVEDPGLPEANYAYKGYVLKKTVRYQYFRILFQSGEEQIYMQLSELHLYTDDPAAAGFADANAPSGAVSLYSRIDRSTVSGPGGTGSHTVDCLFDNKAQSGASGSNKYCVGGNDITVEWQMTEPAVITDYVVYTANDTEGLPARNPIRWTMYGSEDGESYEVVHDVEDAGLPVANYTPTAYTTGCTTAYRYYRLEMHTAESADCLQLSEICLFTR